MQQVVNGQAAELSAANRKLQAELAERHRLEAELKRANQQLEVRLGHQATQLVTAIFRQNRRTCRLYNKLQRLLQLRCLRGKLLLNTEHLLFRFSICQSKRKITLLLQLEQSDACTKRTQLLGVKLQRLRQNA